MATNYNRFDKVEDSKFGTVNIKEIFDTLSTTTRPQTLDDDIASAVPIWLILGITEEEYIKKYRPDNEMIPEPDPEPDTNKEEQEDSLVEV